MSAELAPRPDAGVRYRLRYYLAGVSAIRLTNEHSLRQLRNQARDYNLGYPRSLDVPAATPAAAIFQFITNRSEGEATEEIVLAQATTCLVDWLSQSDQHEAELQRVELMTGKYDARDRIATQDRTIEARAIQLGIRAVQSLTPENFSDS